MHARVISKPVSPICTPFSYRISALALALVRSLAACLLDGRLEELGVGSRSLVGVGHGTGRLDQRQKSKASQREPIAQHQSTHREHDGATYSSGIPVGKRAAAALARLCTAATSTAA